MIFQAKGVTQSQCDQVLHQVNPDNRLPPGAIYHVGGPFDDGFCVVEIWESEEAIAAFNDAAVDQAIKNAKIGVKPVMFNTIDK